MWKHSCYFRAVPSNIMLLCVHLQDGMIDYNEFVAMMRKGNGGMGRRNITNGLVWDSMMIEG